MKCKDCVRVYRNDMKIGYQFVTTKSIVYTCKFVKEVENGNLAIYGHTDDQKEPDGWFTADYYDVIESSVKSEEDPLGALMGAASSAAPDMAVSESCTSNKSDKETTIYRLAVVKDVIKKEYGHGITDEGAFILMDKFHLSDGNIEESDIIHKIRYGVKRALTLAMQFGELRLDRDMSYAAVTALGLERYMRILDGLRNGRGETFIYNEVYCE